MNKATQLLKEVKTLLGMEVKLAQMKLEDGVTTIEAEAFEVGFSVGIVTEEGVIPLPVGEYTLEDGMVLVVTEEGIIAELKEAAAPEEVPAEPVAEMEAEPQADKAKKIVESIVKESFFAEIEKLKAENIELKAQLEAKKEEVKEEVVELSAEPAVEPIKHNPESAVKKIEVHFASKRQETTLDRVLNKLNNK